jgi:hypothetical protein
LSLRAESSQKSGFSAEIDNDMRGSATTDSHGL